MVCCFLDEIELEPTALDARALVPNLNPIGTFGETIGDFPFHFTLVIR